MRLVGAVVLAALATAAAAADVRYERERVSGRFDAVSPADAVQALATATGAEVHGTVATTHELHVDLDGVSLEEALHRILGAQSFTVRYGEGGRPKTIVLQSLADAPAPPPRTSPAAGVTAAAAERRAFPVVLSKIFDRHRPLALPDPLAERLGAKDMSLPDLLDVATADGDPMTRSQASQVVLSTLEREARYRRSFLRSLHDLDSEELTAIVQSPTGPEFEALIEFLAAHSREPTLQKKAGIVYEQVKQARMGAGG